MSTSNTFSMDASRPQALQVTEGIPTPPPVAPTLPEKAKVAVSFLTTASDALLAVIVGQILKGLTGNAHFPAPVPALADIDAARNAFVNAMNAGRGGPQQVATLRQLRATLVALVRSLALYVQQTGKGERVLLLGSGFPLQKQRVPNARPSAPIRLRLKRGKVSGQLVVRCEKVAAVAVYQWRYALASDPTAWTIADPSFATRVTFEGLQRGQDYHFQVRAIGRHGAGDWSDTAVLMVV